MRKQTSMVCCNYVETVITIPICKSENVHSETVRINAGINDVLYDQSQ